MNNININKVPLFYDGIYYCVKMARSAYKSLVEILCELALTNCKGKELEDLAEPAVVEAWSIVDSLNRLYQLLNHTPRLKQNAPELVSFYRKIKPIEDLRHSIQHLDKYLEQYSRDKIPAWGRLSWVCPISQTRYMACMILLGDYQPNPSLMPSHLGENMRKPIDFITLTTKNSVCLTHMIDALDRIMPWLDEQLENIFNRKHQLIYVGFGINVKQRT